MRRLGFLAVFLLGALLRLWNLGPQVMSDDELHAVRTALGNPVSRILVTYQRVDNTIPLTAFYRLLLDGGMKLNETVVRLPAVISGLLLLALAPLWVARRLGWGTALVFAGLLAISPGLVFYSRIARSYSSASGRRSPSSPGGANRAGARARPTSCSPPWPPGSTWERPRS
jgi:hypothetical protein